MIEEQARSDRAILLRLGRDLRMENATVFQAQLKAAWADLPVVILDLEQVEYIDSSGMGALIHLAGLLKQEARTLYLYRVNRLIQSVLKLSGIQSILTVMDPADFAKHFQDR